MDGRERGKERLTRRLPALALLVLAALALAAPAAAVEPYLIHLGLLGGTGGTLDADEPDPGFGGRTLELQLGTALEERTVLLLRVGRLEFGDGDRLGNFLAPELEYATIAGEYRYYRGWYDSGLFLGLGAYRLGGQRIGGGDEETAVGLTGGVTGDFELGKHVSLLGQLSGHYVELGEAQLFATALAGLAIKF